jgi:O-antigen ligase
MFQYLNYSYVPEQSFLNRFDYKSELLFLDLVTNSSSIELIKNEFDLFKYPYGSDYIFQGPFGLDYIKKGFDIFQYPSKNYYRFAGPFGDEFIAGGFILRFSPFLLLVVLGICRKKKNIFFKSLIIFSVILIFVLIFITGDRAPFFILILVSSLLILLFFEKKYILILTSILIFIIFILSISSDQKKKRYINEVLVSIGFQNNEFTLDTGYGHLFYSAIKIWIDKPLLGAGTKNYRKICSRPGFNFETKYNIELCSTHPHNYVLELLSEVGLMGVISFYLIFFYLLRELGSIKKLLKKNLDDLNVRFAILSLIFILWPLSTTGSIITNFNSIVLWLVFGLAYSSISITKKSYLILLRNIIL